MKVYKDRLTVVAERRTWMVTQLQQPERYGATVPSEAELLRLTDDQLLAKVAERFQLPMVRASNGKMYPTLEALQQASEMIDESIAHQEQWKRTQERQRDREEARLARRPKRKMTLEQALERAKELEKERMELVAFINTIPEYELDNFERLTGMWAKPNMNSDSGYTLSKLIKIFKLVLNGRKDPAALQARLDAISNR